MSDMLRVTTPVMPKDYNPAQNMKPQTPEQVFELGNVDYVNKPTDRDSQLAEQNLKDQAGAGLPKLQAAISKDPAMASSILKGVLSSETLAAIKDSGNAELLNKVTEFASEVLLSPNELAGDMLRQQDEATLFSGELWSALTDMVKNLSGSPYEEEITTAVMDFIKAASQAASRDNIVTSVASSLRYLANETAQSREIIDLLRDTANNLTPENFTQLRGDVQALVGYLENSLLLNDRTQNLLSLITYNLSRFGADPDALGDSFQAVLNMAPDQATADKLNTLFTQFVETARLPEDIKLAALQDNPSAAAQRSMTMLTERIANSAAEGLGNIPKEQLSEEISKIVEEFTALMGQQPLKDVPEQPGQPEQPVPAEENIPPEQPEQPEQPQEPQTTQTTQAPEREPLPLEQGVDTLKKMLAPHLPNNMRGGLNTMFRDFEKTRDLNTLIDRLSIIVNKTDDLDKKITLAQGINTVLTEMARNQGISYRPPTTMENMLDFLIKNINDPSLRSLSDMTSPEMIQGMLSAPGVFTPLLHFLVPLEEDGSKAFGELWADPNAEGSGDGSRGSHLFLCFEVENAGYFEMELFASGKNVSVSLLCPEGTEKNYLPLKDSIPVMAASCGYTAEKTRIEPLKRRRDLTRVFPALNEIRRGLNVSV